MKIIFTVFIIVCVSIKASAQADTGLLYNRLNHFNLKGLTDTTLSKLNFVYQSVRPGIFNDGLINIVPLANVVDITNAHTVYSRMPAAHLHHDDKMPVATPLPEDYRMPVKRIIVVDPLKPAVPAI